MASVPNARLFAEGGVTGFVGGAVATVVWLAAESAGVPTVVDIPNVGTTALQWTNFMIVSVIAGLGAALVALLADGRRASRRIFTSTAIVVLVLSMAPLVTQPDVVALSTRLTLASTHVVVYLLVVPRLAGRLRAR
jgi:cytochrome bd-type quinol oxidase subunit 2